MLVPLTARPGRWLTRARGRGWQEASRATLGSVAAWWSSRGILVVMWRAVPADAPPPERETRSEPLESRAVELGPGDAAAYARDIATDSVSSFSARLARGDRCFGIRGGEGLVHASWVSTGPTWVGELRRFFCPPPRSAYVYESYTRPEARGRGIYPRALRSIATLMAAEGRSELWIAATADNAPSLGAIGKAGFTLRFEIGFEIRRGRARLDLPLEARSLVATTCPEPRHFDPSRG